MKEEVEKAGVAVVLETERWGFGFARVEWRGSGSGGLGGK